ncbi:MAG: DNA adenine methylase [SAR324 cluster bacterium]|nr:DNA adenine methylase [SAR324 cluster bacterium]
MCKPILKWVGGKRQVITEIKKLMPRSYNRYFEPFVGGGALFFDLKPKNALINDSNKELLNLYTAVKETPNELITSLSKHKNEAKYYYKTRILDRDSKSYDKLSNLERASRFIYLNKTGFNGLYRVNLKGQCNVPFGSYKNPRYCESENMLRCSELLKDTEITSGDFENIKNKIKKGDFIYLDPPYVPINTTSSFTSYTKDGFDADTQRRLRYFCDYIDKKGAYFMLSNSYTDFILELYKIDRYTINTIHANRSINSKGSGRGKVREVLITNY